MAGFMQKDLREEKGILMDGEKLPGLMKKVGFVDVRKRRIKTEIGPWGPGSFSCTLHANNPDPRKHQIAATCANVWTAAFHAFGAQLVPKYYHDERDAEAFMEAISEELHNPNYQLCCYMFYPPLYRIDVSAIL